MEFMFWSVVVLVVITVSAIIAAVVYKEKADFYKESYHEIEREYRLEVHILNSKIRETARHCPEREDGEGDYVGLSDPMIFALAQDEKGETK